MKQGIPLYSIDNHLSCIHTYTHTNRLSSLAAICQHKTMHCAYTHSTYIHTYNSCVSVCVGVWSTANQHSVIRVGGRGQKSVSRHGRRSGSCL